MGFELNQNRPTLELEALGVNFEDKVKPLVKLIGHRFIGGGGPNIIGRIDLKVEDDHITFENDERKVCYIDCEDDWKFVDEDEDFGISDIYDDTRWPPTSHVEESASSD
uniref:Uncharacterized protein n=1 Tax=Vitis vinifera TaxID=29760 RepID=A5BJP2_VITVI|nr:hypothetical protein VITISV_001875 [Vitis vinifera]